MIPVISAAINLATGWLNGRTEIKKAEQKQQAAEARQKTKLISDHRQFNHSWELAALSADRLALLRQFSFWLFTAPILYTVYDPVEAQRVWQSLDTVPEWIIGVQLAMTGFIWAAKPLSNLGAMVASRRYGVNENRD